MKRPIAISLSPNTQFDDVWQAVKVLFTPWRYQTGGSVGLLEQWFRQYFGISHAISFSSGRGALYAVLKSLGIGKGDEVIVQAFTCVAVPNAVLWSGATPIYADIDNTLTLDPLDIEKKISKKTKAIIIQHTFGIPASLKQILTIAQKYNIDIIEDVAHTIGGTQNGQKLGTFGRASIFSFGRDKAFSSVFGGMAITDDEALGKLIRAFQRKRSYPSLFWTMQQLFHPIAFSVILPLYDFLSIGKGMLFLFQKIHLLSFPVLPKEKQGEFVSQFVAKLPNALAVLALLQMKKIKEYNTIRISHSRYYVENLPIEYKMPYIKEAPLLRFPILVQNRDKLLLFLKKKRIYVGSWYASCIDPKGVNLKKINYKLGICKQAELAAEQIVNLPTYPTLSAQDVRKIVEAIKKYGTS